VNTIATGFNSNELIPDESQALSIVEKENKIYKNGIVTLRELKGTIERLKQLMEVSQRKLQKDFDEWYARMYELLDTESSVASKDMNETMEYDRAPKENIINQMEPSASETPSSRIELPPGVTLTGDEEADNDIIAFYKAKEALMARSRSLHR
jgi:1,2-phenylacetyl-CoA epoxidase catalytic subunit